MTDPDSTKPYPPLPGPAIPRWLVAFLLAAVMLFGLFLRVEDFTYWQSASDVTFFNDKPLLGALDGYFYLRMARDLIENTYTVHDPLRNAPEGYPRPMPPPLLSCLAAGLCQLTGWQLDWVGFFLPACLGALLALPLFAFGHKLSGAVGGLTAALAGLAAPYMVYRGCMGWFDTDCLNVTLTLATAYCFMRFSSASSFRRFGWFLAGLLCTCVFFWWWDQSPSAVLILSLSPLLISLFYIYRPQRRKDIVIMAVPALLILLFVTLYFNGIRHHLENWVTLAQSQIQHITKQAQSQLPNFAISITEQNPPPLSYVIGATTGSLAVFILSALGGVVLLIRKIRIMVFLLPALAIGLLALTCAERFLIFLIPFLSLGLGALISGLWNLSWLHRSAAAAAVLCGVLALFPPVQMLIKDATAWPKTEAARVAGMVQLAENTPTNALIWTWWDNGYAVGYFARRATLNDGQIHGAELARYAALPLTTTNPVLSVRFMQFYAEHGANGMRSISPENLTNPESYPAPTNGRPVYIFLDSKTLATAPVWMPFGAIGTNVPETVYQPVFNLVMTPGGVYGPQGLVVNTEEGILHDGGNGYALIHFMVREANTAWMNVYSRADGGCFEFMVPRGFGVLMNQEVSESIFNRLFVRADPTLGKWFDPTVNQSPNFQIWHVIP